jgi:hypothetical protein
MTSVIRAAVTILDDSRDWVQWYSIIKNTAKIRGVFDYLDVEKETLPPQPTEPVSPTIKDVLGTANTYKDLSPEQKEEYKFLVQVYRTDLDTYKVRKKDLSDVYDLIISTVASQYRPHIIDQATPWGVLTALKKQVAPSLRTQKLALAREYNALKRNSKGQSVDKWLSLWESTYAEAVKIKLNEINDHQALYDFLGAMKSLAPMHAAAVEASLDVQIDKNTDIPTFNEIVGRFRNHLRLRRATSNTTQTSFATLQGESQTDSPTSALALTTRDKPPPKCLCDELHFFSECPYIVKQIRPKGWVANEQLARQVEEKIGRNNKIKEAIANARKRANQDIQKAKAKQAKQAAELQGETAQQKSDTTATAPLGSFAVDRGEIEIKDTWILDSGSNLHICNDHKRFIFERMATEDDKFSAGKTEYSIEAYGSVNITVDTPNGSRTVKLLDVALAPGFLTNTASLDKFTSKGVHWDTQKQCLYADGEIFCYVQRVGNYWALEHSPSPSSTAFASFKSLKEPRTDRSAPAERWHDIMGHIGKEPISKLQNNVVGAVITDLIDKSPCPTCDISKAKEIVSRRPGVEFPVDKPLKRVGYDLIPMNPSYNSHVWVSHFRCMVTSMDFVYTHAKKSQAQPIVVAFLNLVERQYKLSVRFFRTDGERTLGDIFKLALQDKGIRVERSAPDTQAQNGAAERAGALIIEKARCMRVQANLPADMWPEVVQTAAYLNNRTPKRRLGWKTPHEALTGLKPNLAHLHVYGCRAYPHNKHIPKLDKLRPRAHLGYLIGYESTNIFRIWIPSQQKIIRTRDVTFDETRFYRLDDLDMGYILRQEMPRLIELLEPHPTAHSAVEIDGEDYNKELDYALSAPAEWPGAASTETASESTSKSAPSEQATNNTRTHPMTPEPTPPPSALPPTSIATTTAPDAELPAPASAPSNAANTLENQSDFNVRNILPEGS